MFIAKPCASPVQSLGKILVCPLLSMATISTSARVLSSGAWVTTVVPSHSCPLPTCSPKSRETDHLIFLFYFFGCTYGLWKCPGQGLNSHHSSDLNCYSDSTQLTFCMPIQCFPNTHPSVTPLAFSQHRAVQSFISIRCVYLCLTKLYPFIQLPSI